MTVATEPDEVSAGAGWCGWEGGYGTVWCTDPHRNMIEMALTQTCDVLFDGGGTGLITLALQAAG